MNQKWLTSMLYLEPSHVDSVVINSEAKQFDICMSLNGNKLFFAIYFMSLLLAQTSQAAFSFLSDKFKKK